MEQQVTKFVGDHESLPYGCVSRVGSDHARFVLAAVMHQSRETNFEERLMPNLSVAELGETLKRYGYSGNAAVLQ